MFRWDDLQFALAVSREGSAANAAKALGVSHTTVLRRIQALESETGARLFEKSDKGYAIAQDRREAFEVLEQAGQRIEAARLEIAAAAVAPGQILRLTSTDTFCTTILPEVVAKLGKLQPNLQVALMSYNTRLNLANAQADITIRPAQSLPDDLEGEVAAHLGFAAYRSISDPGVSDWIGLAGPLARSVAGQWLEGKTLKHSIHTDSFLVLRELVASGQGNGVMPCVLGDGDPRLHRITSGNAIGSVPVWVAGHRNLADTGYLNRVRRQLVEVLTPFGDRLLGDLAA